MSPDDIHCAPSLRFLGARGEVISTMRYSRHPAILQFLETWDQISARDRLHIPFEAVALVAHVDIAELIGAYLLGFRTLQQQKSALKAMSRHPEVVDSTIDFALRRDGVSDRKMLHEAVGFLPTPRGVSITQNFGQNLAEPEEKEKLETATAPDIEDIFPQINDREEKWQDSRQKLLEGTN